MSDAGSSGVVLLGQDDPSTRMVHHALRERFGDVAVLLEPPLSRWRLVRNRLRRLGWTEVAGQLLFLLLVAPRLRRRGAARIREIAAAHGLKESAWEGRVQSVPSMNSPEAIEALRRLAPRVVVVNGTRILGRGILSSVDVPFINTHAGITPLYRGVHGGFWALAEGRPDLVGTTVHLVDLGIDTGEVIGQARFEVSPEDSFATYPYLHLAAGIPLLLQAVERALEGRLQTRRPLQELPSKLRYHPTLWGYLAARRRGVR